MSNQKVKVETDVWKLSNGSFYEGEYTGEDRKAVKICKAEFEYKIHYLEEVGYLKHMQEIRKKSKKDLKNFKPNKKGGKKLDYIDDFTDYTKFLPKLYFPNFSVWNIVFSPKLWGLLFLALLGSCYYAFSLPIDLSQYEDPDNVLSPEERREICNEIYNMPSERGYLIGCLAKIYQDN